MLMERLSSLPSRGRNKKVNEWMPQDSLIQDNNQLTRENFDSFAAIYKSTMVYGHSSGYRSTIISYTGALIATRFFPPMVNHQLCLWKNWHLIHRGGHLGISNLFWIGQDNSITPMMKVQVNPSSPWLHNIFQYDQHCTFHNNFIDQLNSSVTFLQAHV